MEAISMQTKPEKHDFVERLGRWLRIPLYGLVAIYLLRWLQMIGAANSGPTIGWQTAVWQVAKDISTVLMCFVWQRYFANYSERRASVHFRRRDAWLLPIGTFGFLILNLPTLLGSSWPWAIPVVVLIFAIVYVLEMRQTKHV